MAGAKRERELARAKHERQQARRTAAAQRARRRAQIVAAAFAVVVVIGGVFALSQVLDGGSPTAAAPTPSASATTSPAAAKPSGNCTYTRIPKGSGQQEKFVGLPGPKQDTGTSYGARVVTNRGTLDLRLLTDKAPCAVNSFRFLAGKGFYDNTRCHRMLVDTEGILQCGDPTGTGRGGPGYSFPDENLGGATYPRGTVAMANSGPNTNGSQFFLVFRASSFPPNYTPFGRISKGLDILDDVAKGGVQKAVQKSENTPPKLEVVIKRIVVDEQN